MSRLEFQICPHPHSHLPKETSALLADVRNISVDTRSLTGRTSELGHWVWRNWLEIMNILAPVSFNACTWTYIQTTSHNTFITNKFNKSWLHTRRYCFYFTFLASESQNEWRSEHMYRWSFQKAEWLQASWTWPSPISRPFPLLAASFEMLHTVTHPTNCV